MSSSKARTTAIVLSLLGAAGLAMLAGASPTKRYGIPERSIEPSPSPNQGDDDKPLDERFASQEWEGLICQLKTISANVSYSSHHTRGSGALVSRSMTITGVLTDFTGRRVYRVTAPPRVIELTNTEGDDLTAIAQMSLRPQSSNIMPFTIPGKTNVYQNFSVSLNKLVGGISGIGRLVVDVDVEMAADVSPVDLLPKLRPEMIELAPNFHAAVTQYELSDEGRLNAKIEYRITHNDGPSPGFFHLEILDTSGSPVYSGNTRREMVTRDTTLGEIQIRNVSVGDREIATIRLDILTDLIRHTFRFEERDLPMFAR